MFRKNLVQQYRYCFLVAALVLMTVMMLVFQPKPNLHLNSSPVEVPSQHLDNHEIEGFAQTQHKLRQTELNWPGASQNDRKEIDAIWRRLRRVSRSLERLWCATRDVMSNGGFCVSQDRVFTGGNQISDPELCYFIEALIGNASLVDLGAGLGQYGMCFLRRNDTQFRMTADQKVQYLDNVRASFGDIDRKPQIVYSWHGFDGALNIDDVSGGFIEHADLSDEGLWLGRQWDWVMSVEVGEHIHHNYENFFLDNLVRHACKGIILTWAVRGQPGHHHINNHNNDYIKRKMRDRGLIVDTQAEKLLREALTNYSLSKTSMVFRLPKPKSCLTG
ncbi:hypothetical protein FHG87_011007 [Trinorchestia longiramus]|nr:hypothetical protein FHG87_011007 [Trinorchestia longiramus]